MSENKHPILAVLNRQKATYMPIWLMRQAGRYLPEYRKLRQKHGGFLQLCKNPQLACEITLQPIKRFNLDAAILFSDILMIPDALGLELDFKQGEGPFFHQVIDKPSDLQKITILDLNKLDYLVQAIKLTLQELNNKLPLIGFVGSPWTIATYMIEGGKSHDFRKIRKKLYSQPEFIHSLLDLMSNHIISSINLQIESGVNIIKIFDTWGGILTHEKYLEFSLFYAKKIISRIKKKHPNIPIMFFTKGGGMWLKDSLSIKADCLGVDWTYPLIKAKEDVADKCILEGNLDPAFLYSSFADIRKIVKQNIAIFSPKNNHIFNLGHGVLQDTNPDKVKCLVDSVHELSS